MPSPLISGDTGEPFLDLFRFARRGSGRRGRLSRAEIELVARTVNRIPEVMVKVLIRGGQDLRAVRRHLAYLNRGGELELETDDGRELTGAGSERELLVDWDLDLEEHRRRAELLPRQDARPPKLVHKLLFSMPPGTPADKVIAAVRNFAREEFGLKHRYAMVLHTDEPHPHVHVVVKAVSEQGERLNIRKATLRAWRWEFARHLRALGVAANATQRAVRGSTKSPKLDGIYRAEQRGESRHTRARVESVAADLLKGHLGFELGKSRLMETRKAVERGWRAVGDILESEERPELAAQVRDFVARMPPARTDREMIAEALRSRVRKCAKSR
jgi:Relaxase/Mobilisation nuclease domain